MKTKVGIGVLATIVLFAGVSAFGQNLPRFEPLEGGRCFPGMSTQSTEFRVECGHLLVPEVRGSNNRRTLQLAVAILHSNKPSGVPPLVMLHGGPGGSGLRVYTRDMLATPLVRQRDIVIYDQRASGLSEPKLCPEIDEQANVISNLATSAERAERREANNRQCVEGLKALGSDTAAYTTEANAADLIDLRRVLGYSTWDVYGGSYGARLAQEVMRRDPKSVRAVVLASPGIPGPTTWVEMPLSKQRWLERIFAACSAQPSCKSAFPDLENDLNTLYSELNEKPIQVARDNGLVYLDGNRFIGNIGGPPARIARIPMLINELLRGDKTRAARELIGAGGTDSGNRALRNMVVCYDIYGPEYKKALEAMVGKLKTPFRDRVDESEDCEIFQNRYADPATHKFVQSEIPTLILTAEFDDRTPTEHAKQIAAGFKNVYLYEFPNQTHGQRPGGCHRSILVQFLEDPYHEPDASCISTMSRLKFETTWTDTATVVLRIQPLDNVTTPFTGRWSLDFPGLRGSATIDARTDGRTLIGTIAAGPNVVEIYEGRIDGNVVTFKAKSPDGDRSVTLTGILDGDEIDFTRSIEVRPGGAPGGFGVFGVSAVRELTAKRVN